MGKTGAKVSMRIGIIGSTGVGKSTVCEELHSRLAGFDLSLEPIPTSLKRFLDAQGSNKEYFERLRHDFNIVKAHYRLLKKRNKPKVIMERPSAENDYCFGLENRDSLMHQVYMELSSKLTLDFIVYLKAAPDVITDRINHRARPGEEFYSREWVKNHCQKYDDHYRDIALAHNCRRIETIECSIKTPIEIVTEIIHKLDLSEHERIYASKNKQRLLG